MNIFSSPLVALGTRTGWNWTNRFWTPPRTFPRAPSPSGYALPL